jgi:uncharacterized protein
MKLVLSPAKSLNFDTELPLIESTKPVFLDESQKIQSVLKQKTPKELGALMHISEKLSELNWQRNQDWNLPFTNQNARPALFTFDGDVYSGLDAFSLTSQDIALAQQQIRILSGLYGILKPLDLMQAYRLEMGTKIAIGNSKNLYEFWKTTITNQLNSELEDGELFVNLASTEYFSAVDAKMLKVPVITPEFKDYKNGNLKIISFFAKKARGLMARYIIQNQINTIDGLKSFDIEGYQWSEALSTQNKIIFTR